MLKDTVIIDKEIYRKAGYFRRILAYLMDCSYIYGVGLMYDIRGLIPLIGVIYFTTTMLILGQTAGQYVFDIKTVSKGKPHDSGGHQVVKKKHSGENKVEKQENQINPTTTQILLREMFGRYIGLSFLPIYLLTRNKRTLIDYLTDTYVVEIEPIENPLQDYIELAIEGVESGN